MKKLYLFLHIPAQPIISGAVEEWHELATIDDCYTALMNDIVEQFRLGDIKRGLKDKRQLIIVTATNHEEALATAKTKI